jgi:steroid delta-isomerase-like uncharacterized protein
MRSMVRITLALLLSLSFVVVLSPGRSTGVVAQATPATQATQANEEVVRTFFEQVLSQGNMDLIDDLFAPEFVLHTSADPSQDVQGLEGVMGFVMGLRTAFPDIVYTVEELISEGDSVVVRWHNQGTQQGDYLGIPATGKTVAIGGGNLFHFQGGKLVEEWGFPDSLSILIQLGVIPGGDQLGTATPGPMTGDAVAVATPGTEDANRALMEQFWAAYNAGDADTILGQIFSPDFVNHTPAPGFPASGQGLVDTMLYFASGFPDQRASVEEIVVEGDLVASRVLVSGTHQGTAYGVPPTGRHVTYGGLTIVRIANGKMVENWGFYDQVSILAQIGALGGPPPEAQPAASPIGSPQAAAAIDWAAYSQLEIAASEAGYEAPDSIAGGLVALTFTNNGQTNHMAMLIQAAEGVTIDELETAIKTDPMNQVALREKVLSFGGAGGIAPGKQQRLILNLPAAEYLIADFELDTDQTPFVAKNGLKRLEVTAPAATQPAEPAADTTVDLIDFAFSGIPQQMLPGTYILKVTSSGEQPHELAFVKLDEGVSAQEAFSAVPEPGAPLPFTFWGGVQDMDPGQTAWVEVVLDPGEFVAFCPIVDPATQKPHLMLGMVQSVVVS